MALLIFLSNTGAHKTSGLSRTLYQKEKEVEIRIKLTQLSKIYLAWPSRQ